jgi:hypothetical protein
MTFADLDRLEKQFLAGQVTGKFYLQRGRELPTGWRVSPSAARICAQLTSDRSGAHGYLPFVPQFPGCPWSIGRSKRVP